MSVELRLGGRTLARAHLADRRSSARIGLPLLRRAADSLLASGVRASGQEPTCRSGCAACCRQLVPLANAEAREMRQMIAGFVPQRRRRVESRFAAACKKLQATGLRDLLQAPATIPVAGLEELGRQYLAARIDCPFLENDRCTIYTRRPMACRQHAVSSDPGQCELPQGRVVRIAPLGAPMNSAIDAVEGAAWVPLVLVLEHRPNPAVPRRPALDWLQEIWKTATRGRGRVRTA